jgi:DNA (cytosine-5)-methyltransferase 1
MTNPHAWYLTDLKDIPKNGIKVFSTFACGGGSTMGYKLAGCEVIGANDIDPEMAYHYKLNHKPKYYFLCPIKDLLKKDLPAELFNLDILDGSPLAPVFLWQAVGKSHGEKKSILERDKQSRY